MQQAVLAAENLHTETGCLEPLAGRDRDDLLAEIECGGEIRRCADAQARVGPGGLAHLGDIDVVGMFVSDQHFVSAVKGGVQFGEDARIDHQGVVAVVEANARVGELRQRGHATSASNMATNFSMRRSVSASLGV